MKKVSFREKLQYKFDNLMSKGTAALVGLLFLITLIVVVAVGIIAFLCGQGTSVGNNIWISLMHAIDAGNLAGNDAGNIVFVVLMSLVTLCGIFITSILIGIITTGFESKLSDLKKGNSKVIENNHTIILGYNDSIFTLLSELVTANENQKDGCIVILSEENKETIEEAIAVQIPDLKTTRVICRTGGITDVSMLEKCSIETCRSIIINASDDFMTIKSILAINSCLKGNADALDHTQNAHIVATIHEKMNYEAAQIAGEGRAELILSQDAIARIIAHTCRQPGLSNVLIELFDYAGDELYFEAFPELTGKRFGDVLNLFQKAIVFGYRRAARIYLNPDKESMMEEGDELILLMEDDHAQKPVTELPILTGLSEIECMPKKEDTPENILILGINFMLEQILLELDHYVVKGSRIWIADHTIPGCYAKIGKALRNIQLDTIACNINERQELDQLTQHKIEHILMLSEPPEEIDRQTKDCNELSDAKTLLKLIHLRDIAQKTGKTFSITSEMLNIVNQKLARVAKANDLVIGSNIINLILTQVSENRDLAKVFRELLDEEGSEIYMRKASEYVKLKTQIDFYHITDIACRRNEIAIGYKKQTEHTFQIITNPMKSEKVTFEQGDYIIVLAEE